MGATFATSVYHKIGGTSAIFQSEGNTLEEMEKLNISDRPSSIIGAAIFNILFHKLSIPVAITGFSLFNNLSY